MPCSASLVARGAVARRQHAREMKATVGSAGADVPTHRSYTETSSATARSPSSVCGPPMSTRSAQPTADCAVQSTGPIATAAPQ
jgi:hypothetical protein